MHGIEQAIEFFWKQLSEAIFSHEMNTVARKFFFYNFITNILFLIYQQQISY